MNSEIERAKTPSDVQSIGTAIPPRFSDLQTEWQAVRQGCGLIDGHIRGLLRMTGADRTTFLQGMVTNDVAGLQPGQGTYAALLTIQGKLVADFRIYVLPDELWLDVPATRTAVVQSTLEKYIIADEVEFAADETWSPLAAVEGPQAARTLVAVLGNAVEGLQQFAHRAATFDGSPVHLAAVSHTGEEGYLIFGSPALAASLWAHLRAAGAEPVGTEALNVLRLEAGIPWYGVDFDDSTLIAEAGLDAAISYRKGCYLGQEVVERVSARGQVHRKLVGLRCTGERVPPASTALFHADHEVGWTTSAAFSPAGAAVIALAYVRTQAWEIGTELHLESPGSGTTARVVALPFHAHSSYESTQASRAR